MTAPKLLRQARFYLFLDRLMGLTRLPLRLSIWLLGAVYVLFCMVSWGIILWVLGERHIGILKILIMLSSVMVWVLALTSIYSIWG